MSLSSPEGRLLVADPPAPAFVGQSFESRDWYRGVTTEHSPYVSRAFAAADGPKTVTVAALVRAARGGRIIGILSVGLEPPAQALADEFPSSQGTRLTITDQAGTTVARSGANSNALTSLRGDPLVLAALRGNSGSHESVTVG